MNNKKEKIAMAVPKERRKLMSLRRKIEKRVNILTKIQDELFSKEKELFVLYDEEKKLRSM